MISDLNRLFARAVSGVYRHCLNQNCLNVAKCNLGKVNLEAMLVSSFPSYSWGGPMPLAGAPHDLYTQLLACSSSLRASLCFDFSHPSLPLGGG